RNNKDVVYFTGNSLGLQPKSVTDHINIVLQDWANLGVMGHHDEGRPWIPFHEQFAAPVAKIVGAKPDEVVVMNLLTVNLHLLLASFYRPTEERFKIICEAKAFPSDQYALDSQVKLHGLNPDDTIIRVSPREGEFNLRQEDIVSTIQQHGSSVALVLFGGINYYSGQVFDIQGITAAAHEVGAYAGFDLAHAAGNIRLQLHDWNVDFACWCTYKYLNSSPGGIAGIYVHEKHATNTAFPRLAGWWGTNKETRFQMKPEFEPIATAEGWQVSNQPILLLAAHKASVDIFEEAGMDALVEKSRKLTGFLFQILDDINANQEQQVIQVITPTDAHGCQVSMHMLERGREIFDALMSEGVIGDWREPNVIRIAPVPLYNTFEDIWKFGDIISRILKSN
ncbi:MAG: kynureninase, partial [Chitinophagaceae bacterium]